MAIVSEQGWEYVCESFRLCESARICVCLCVCGGGGACMSLCVRGGGAGGGMHACLFVYEKNIFFWINKVS